MITVELDGRSAVVTERELITSGSYGIQCQFSFAGDEWEAAYAKMAVFRSGDDGAVADVPIVDPYICTIPYEVMKEAGEVLFIGVYGTDGEGNIIVPTVWASSGVVKQGVVPASATAEPPTPSEWDQMLAIASQAAMEANTAMTDAAEAVVIAGGAGAQAERAKGYADSAAGSAGDAADSATEAERQARLAESSAGTAQTAAGQASDSADTALQKAEAADGSARAAAGSASTAEGHAETAEAFAKGTKGGVPDPAYAQINAAYFAGQAQDAQLAIENMGVSATSVPAGSDADVHNTPDPETGYAHLSFEIPRGDPSVMYFFKAVPSVLSFDPNASSHSFSFTLTAYKDVGGVKTKQQMDEVTCTYYKDSGGAEPWLFPIVLGQLDPSISGTLSSSGRLELSTYISGTTIKTTVPIVAYGEKGDPGEGVPTGGTTGQYLRKESNTDYDADWDTLTAGDVAYSDEGYYSSGTVGHKLQSLDSEDIDYSYGGDKESGTVGEALDDLVYSDQLHEEKVRGDLLEKFANLPEEDWQYDPCVTAYWDMELHHQKLMWVAVVTVTNLSYPAYVMLWEAEEFGPVPGLLKPVILDYGVTYKFNVESENSAVSTYVVKNGTGSSSGTFVLQEDDSIGIGFKITPTGTMTDTFKVYVEMYDPKTIADLDETVHELQSKDSMIEYDITALYDDVDDVRNTLNNLGLTVVDGKLCAVYNVA